MIDVVEFLKYLSAWWYVEINNLDKIVKYSNVIGKKNIYFCWGIENKKYKDWIQQRCEDDDIWNKNYFVVDFDVRLTHYEKTWKVMDQEELEKECEKIVNKLSENWYWDYCAKVYSWNWLHLYYSWKARRFNKDVYASWVKRVYWQMDDILKWLWYKTDNKCSNIWRIMRLPWTLNPRYKEKKNKETKQIEVLWDMWDIECTLEYFEPKDSLAFSALEEWAEVYKQELEQDKKAQVEIKRIIKQEYKNPDNIRKQINDIPARQIAEDIRGVTMMDKWLDNVALREDKKNMWAYRYKPHNVIVNTWSSMIKTDKNYFTSYELVYYEYANQDKKQTLEYFKSRYWIQIEDKQNKTEIPKKQYKLLWFTYGWDCFEKFDCFMSWELVTVVAESNSGKTTFAMDIIKENANRWVKALYINLEFPIETVWKQRRLYLNGKKKRNLTDLDPLSNEEEYEMERYVKDNLSKFEYYNEPKGIELERLIQKIIEYNDKWYVLFVIDTFSRITGNLDSKISHTNQNQSMERLQELCQNTWIAIVNLHHTNKKKEFEGSQKIHDLSNVFIMITKEEDDNWYISTNYQLSKDKFVTKTEIKTYWVDNKPSLTPPEKPF